MPQIGSFTRNPDGFFGSIRTLSLDARLAILPTDKSEVENAPDHRVLCEGVEIGAAWDRTSEKAGAYLSIIIDDPSFVQPIRVRLFEADARKGLWTLHWSRSSKSDERT